MTVVHLPWEQGELPANAAVARKIRQIYHELGPSLQLFSAYVLREPMRVCSGSVSDVAAAAGVSAAAGTRLAKALGYESYNAFRRELAEGIQPVQVAVQKLRDHMQAHGPVPEAIFHSLAQDAQTLQALSHAVDAERCVTAAGLLAQAKKIYMLGFDNSAALGALFSHRLSSLGCEVILPGPGAGTLSVTRSLTRLGPEDLVVAIAFPRYLRDTVTMAQFASRQGLRVLSVTDAPASPIAALAHHAVYVPATGSFAATSDAVVLALLDALAAGVARLRPDALESTRFVADLGTYWAT